MQPNSERKVRCFIALVPPEDWITQLAQIQQILRKTIPGEIKWIEPAAIHLTLRFLGQINPMEMENLREILGAIASGKKQFTLRSGKLGVFPNARSPGIIWAGVEDPDRHLAALHAEIDAATKAIGQPTENRPFKPHLTIARVRRMHRTRPKMLLQCLEQVEWFGSEWAVHRVELFQSDLSPAGACYTNRGSFVLPGNSLPAPGLDGS